MDLGEFLVCCLIGLLFAALLFAGFAVSPSTITPALAPERSAGASVP